MPINHEVIFLFSTNQSATAQPNIAATARQI